MVALKLSNDGFSLTELLIVVILLGGVFLGAISIYTSGLKFLNARQAIDVSVSPEIVVETIVKKIVLANQGSTASGGSQLDLRLDESCAGAALATPATTADDNYWHYRFIGTDMRGVCDGVLATTVNAGHPLLMQNLQGGAGSFTLSNPSASGAPTVISIHVQSVTPPVTVDTEGALGAATKR